MKEEYDRWEEENDYEESDKFDECYLCKNKFNLRLCEEECDNGESFEHIDPEDLGDILI